MHLVNDTFKDLVRGNVPFVECVLPQRSQKLRGEGQMQDD